MKSLLLVSLTYLFLSNHTDMLENANQKPVSYLALGDSYTIGESVSERDRWPVLLVERLNEAGAEFATPEIIATTGWATDELKGAINKAKISAEYDMVSLLIGVNNQYRGYDIDVYRKEFEDLLKTAIQLAKGGAGGVFVVSIPDYGFTPFGEEKREEIYKGINDYNAINREIAIQYGVAYFNITDISRSSLDELVASDGLHPSGVQYRKWVELMLESSFFDKYK